MLSACAQLALIEPERWRNDSVISIPNMLKRVDDYTRKVRTLSQQSPKKPAVEEEVEEEQIKKKNIRPPKSPLLKPEARTPHGEFLSVLLTEEEHGKLESRLNGNLAGLIDELDRYSQTDPRAFKKYRNHYAVLLNWGNRKGLIRTPDQLAREENEKNEIRNIFRKGRR